MNPSSGAAVTQYKNCNHDRAAAKSIIKYQMGVIGSECDEVWYEKISNKTLCKTQFFSVRIIAYAQRKMQGFGFLQLTSLKKITV